MEAKRLSEIKVNIPKISTSPHSNNTQREPSERTRRWRRHHGFGARHIESKWKECCKNKEWLTVYDTADKHIGSGGTICLIGPRGTGKTQLAYYLIRSFFKNFDENWGTRSVPSVAYWTVLDFFMAIKSTYGNSDSDEAAVISDLSGLPILVIDEVQVRSETDWENIMLTHLIDRRYRNMKDTILISNQTKNAFIDSIGPSIADRIRETGGIIEMNWESVRGRNT